MIWTTGDQEYGPYLVWAGVACGIAAFLCWVWPKSAGNQVPHRRATVKAGAHSSITENQSGGISFQGERNNHTILTGAMDSQPRGINAAPEKDSAEIRLVFGQDGPYVETNSFNSINVRKTVCVGVRNAGTKYLSNCKLMFEARRPEDGEPERWLRDGPFSLNVGEERYLSVAAYNEPISSQTTSENWIMLSAPPSGNFWRPPMIPTTGGAVTLTATSAESRECKSICKFWVTGGKLYWERVSGDSTATVALDTHHRSPESTHDEFVPMPDAVARAYGELRANGSPWAKAADSFAANGVTESIYFAAALSQEIPIYGKHPPSRIYEIINPDQFKRGSFKNDGSTFHYHGSQDPQFVEVAVKTSDLSKAIDQMRERHETDLR